MLQASPTRAARQLGPGCPAVAGGTCLCSRRLAVERLAASPSRPLPQVYSPHYPQGGRGCTIGTPASLYTPDQGQGSDNSRQVQGDDELHSSNQLILLLTLSVVLLTLPWVVDHPVTLLVPVGLLIVPFTSGALRSLVYEGFALVSGGFRWFWRHRNPAVGAQAQQAPQTGFHSGGAPPQRPVAHGGPAHQADRGLTAWQHHAGPRNTPPHQALSGASAPGPVMQSWARGWRPHTTHTRPAVQPVSAAGPAAPAAARARSVTDLTTPDLDFDSESDVEALGRSQEPLLASGRSIHQSASAYQRVDDVQRTQEDPVECTVYNWDAAEECTRRRRHRPLSELLSNGQ